MNAGELKVVGRRCDKVVFAYRVALDPGFLAYLRKQARLAREHGRAEIAWGVLSPVYKGARYPDRGKFRRVGEVAFAAQAEREGFDVERRTVMWGELRYSRQEHKYLITNEPFFIIAIDPHAPGGDVGPRSERKVDALDANVLPPKFQKALGENEERLGLDRGEPGFTVEISAYAQHLARAGLVAVEKEAEHLAMMMGDMREKRLRRIDLCADVAGATLAESDVSCIVKRSRAAWVKNFADGTWEDARGKIHYPLEHGVADTHGRESGRATFVRASGPMRRVKPRKYVPPVACRDPRLTGISVGRGGAMMMRIYDKREELARSDDRAEERREVEHAIWSSNGWDGKAPVARVEFQIRGEALRELGLRNPDCMQTIERDKDGNAIGHVDSLVRDEVTGKMRKARLADWLDSLWLTCIKWCRLVVPALSKNGNALQADRCELDPRWSLLHTVRFTDRWAMPLPRYRARGAASAAQSLGVALSQAAREGQLREKWEESQEWYERWADPAQMLRDRIRLLMRDVEQRCVDELIEKHGSAARANVHLAVRANAARARFMRKDRQIEPRTPRVVGCDLSIASGVFTMKLTTITSLVA